MTQNRLFLACFLFPALTFPASAASRNYAISPEQIAITVSRMGVQIVPSQVALIADVVASTPAPALQVRFVERFDVNRFMVRLECENSEDCIPFMASIQMNGPGATRLTDVASRLSLLKSSFSIPANPGRPQAIVIRNGSPAVLDLNGDHVHIRIPVICLESGSAGQTIRAADKDHRRVYTAQVVQSGWLRGTL